MRRNDLRALFTRGARIVFVSRPNMDSVIVLDERHYGLIRLNPDSSRRPSAPRLIVSEPVPFESDWRPIFDVHKNFLRWFTA